MLHGNVKLLTFPRIGNVWETGTAETSGNVGQTLRGCRSQMLRSQIHHSRRSFPDASLPDPLLRRSDPDLPSIPDASLPDCLRAGKLLPVKLWPCDG
uniref:Uncharacterized protein n=1 Tax=Kalanchoe fedtschenkoi TaxID=63787 RepID=A0A7N0VHR2_KALFE